MCAPLVCSRIIPLLAFTYHAYLLHVITHAIRLLYFILGKLHIDDHRGKCMYCWALLYKHLGGLWHSIFTFTLRLCMRVCIYIVNEYRDRHCTSQTSSSIKIVMCEMITTGTFYQNRNHRWDITRQVTQVNDYRKLLISRACLRQVAQAEWSVL